MPLSPTAMRDHISQTIMARLDEDQDRRREALQDYLSLTMPNVDDSTSGHLATLVPSILPDLYAKWVSLFIDRLLETVPHNQLEFLCNGSEENCATLVLIYIMFLESERMEQQMEDDLKAYGLKHTNDADAGGIVADFLRAKVKQLRNNLQPTT